MNKDDRNRNVKRERIIMISTSALVLTVLTVTGAYVRNHNRKSMDDGYTLDFTALEDSAGDKWKEIAQGSKKDANPEVAENKAENPDLNPLEVGSDEIKIPGLTEKQIADKNADKSLDKSANQSADQSVSKGMSDGADGKGPEQAVAKGKKDQGDTKQKDSQGVAKEQETVKPEPVTQEPSPVAQTSADSPIVSDELHFTAETLIKPVDGTTLIPYSMDHSVYFATLDQYKYNPAVILGATEGEAVCACATGRVMNVHNDAELGHVVVLSLGDGYQAIYGQLDQIEVPIGAIVPAGAKLATVAAPTKYYSVEGCNVYFQLLKDGKSIDPTALFR